MDNVNEIISDLSKTVDDIINTAKDVNKHSHSRKSLTRDSLSESEKLMRDSSALKTDFEKIFRNFKDSQLHIANNSNEFKSNFNYFLDIISNINNIKSALTELRQEINKLTNLVEEIKEDTDEIFTLALNASIVSSKYSEASGVFDILANKLNEMSNFINMNLENIVNVVKPITDGILKLSDNNTLVLDDVEGGHLSFIGFTDILDKQKQSIDKLITEASISEEKIGNQKRMLDEINDKIIQMDGDADDAVNGSASVIKAGESLGKEIGEIRFNFDLEKKYEDKISIIAGHSRSIWQTAQNVNEKSRSQHEFSLSCVDFCDLLITESNELKDKTEILNQQSETSSEIAGFLSHNLSKISSQLIKIEHNIADSNKTIQQFNKDYEQIDNIVGFLKNILKSMKIIGMLSRIESARDPEEFDQFMTISENINKLQNHIENNIPMIEKNINVTHTVIESVNHNFGNISSIFLTISKTSSGIIDKLGDLINFSLESKDLSQTIINKSTDINSHLNDLKNSLIQLTEIVKKPIEGSAKNIERGKKVEARCLEVKKLISPETAAQNETSEQDQENGNEVDETTEVIEPVS